MSHYLRTNLPFLKLVASIKKSATRREILEALSNDETFQKALREIAKNTVRGAIKLSPSDIKKLKTHKGTIKSLSKKRLSANRKKKLISQSGGFLPILIPIVASLIGELIRSKN
jgi:hypothetical protein